MARPIGQKITKPSTITPIQAGFPEYAEQLGQDLLTKMAILGALGLYMNFVNLFLMLLQFFGNRE